MKSILLRSLTLMLLLVASSQLALSQVSSTASLSGTVLDPTGSVVAGATITVTNPGTGREFSTTTSSNGTFSVPALDAGVYTVRVSTAGFKQAVVKDVKVDVGVPARVDVTLEVGEQTAEVTVVGGAEVLQTETANVTTTITGRQITDLPYKTRNAMDIVTFLPGVATPGGSRTSSISGLPKGSINITFDGLNVQDNLLKSSDGFFTYIQPKTDAVSEVTLSSATPGSESAGEGAIQIKFATRSGSNEWHGSLYEYHRNPVLNANYYFNNLNGLKRARVLLNQFGGRLGGPILKDRAFFFFNYEEFRLPQQQLRIRSVFSPEAQSGIFRYVLSNGTVRSVDLYALAAGKGQTATPDPTVASLLNQIRGSLGSGSILNTSDPNLQQFTFINTGSQIRRFPTVRLDWNVTSRHHVENIWNYQKFDSSVDFLNGADPAFPKFPNHGSQISNRFSETIALRSTISSTLVNEGRFGLTGGTVLFFPEITTAQFANQGGLNIGLGAAGITSPTVRSGVQRRNTPVWQANDTLTWTRGVHTFNFGFSFTQINEFFQNVPRLVPGITLSLATADPAQVLFSAANFPGSSTADRNRARAIYAVLTGRITAVSGDAFLNEKTLKYSYLGDLIQRPRQREVGYFAQDSWRFRPNLTITGGIRWEIQYPFKALNKVYSTTSFAGLFGVSGAGNLFKPGTLTGSPTTFDQFTGGRKAYNTDFSDWAPSVGIAWSPKWNNSWIRRALGSEGQSVLRAGYSIAYNREGINFAPSILGSNAGGFTPATRSITNGNLTPGTLLRNGAPGPAPFPDSPTYPITATLSTSANAFLPDLGTGKVHSWTASLQRELNKDTVLEFRYVGNYGTNLWRQYNINETNIVENGFVNEFKLAMRNFAANNAAGGSRANSFAYFGPGTGTSPLPITLAHFSGVALANAANAALYTSSLFKNSSFTTLLTPALPNSIGFANLLQFNPSLFAANAAKAGLPANLFIANPQVGSSGAFLVDNSSRSWYNAAVIELRRRLARGLLVQANYTFSKSISNFFQSSSVGFLQYTTLRNKGLDKGESPLDIRQAFKSTFIYELPFGKGHRFGDLGAGTWAATVGRLVGGWSINGTSSIQSGTPFSLGNVSLVGITKEQLQDSLQIRHGVNASGAPVVFYLPQDIIDNTIAAFNGVPPKNGRYIAPANLNHVQAFGGDSGFSRLVLKGPHRTLIDLSVVKTTKVTERINFEFRAEFLNAFNNINFTVGNPTADVTNVGGLGTQTFGQTTFAFQDPNSSQDPGGRLIQFVARINF